MNTPMHSVPSCSQPEQNEPSVGALRGDVWLTVQTYQAQQLIHGRRRSGEKPAIIGLVGFADQLKLLWQAARQDDPYADWWLIKVEQGVADCRRYLHTLFDEYAPLLTAQQGFQLAIAQSTKPRRIGLAFANPYAFRGAQMLADFDRLGCLMLTLRYLGFDEAQALATPYATASRRLRRVFTLPFGYVFFDIDRAAVAQGTQPARQAQEKMGEIPPDILQGRQLPSLRPAKPTIKPSPFASNGNANEPL